MQGRRAVFLDRDNTLNYDPGYLSDPALVRLLPGVVEGLRMLQERGLLLVLISNQSGVARGKFTTDDLARVHTRLVELLAENKVHLDGVYYCLHAPSDHCDCRKPRPGLIMQAARELQINLGVSFMVGDKLSDIEAGRLAGCTTVLIPGPETTTISCSADIVCATMTEAAEQMLAKIARWEQRDNEFLMLSPQDDSA